MSPKAGAKTSPVAKPAAPKPAPAKPETKPTMAAPAKSAAPKPAAPKPVASPAAEQPKPPEAPPRPVAAQAPAPVPPPADRRPNIPDRLPPRPMGKAEIFVEGDHVVYPTHGVGKVERIATEEIAGHKLELIHITFEENRMTLRVPVTKARSAGLRKLATRKLFDEALTVLKGRARIKRTMWSRRAQEYEAKINSGDPLAIAEVVRDLHRNAGQPDQSFSERQIYEAAMDRLAAELAALDKTDKLTAATKLTNFLKTV
jgi:CarD family transcriptional regulator